MYVHPTLPDSVHLPCNKCMPFLKAVDKSRSEMCIRDRHILLLLGDFRLADALRDAYLARRNVRDLIRLAVDADAVSYTHLVEKSSFSLGITFILANIFFSLAFEYFPFVFYLAPYYEYVASCLRCV